MGNSGGKSGKKDKAKSKARSSTPFEDAPVHGAGGEWGAEAPSVAGARNAGAEPGLEDEPAVERSAEDASEAGPREPQLARPASADAVSREQYEMLLEEAQAVERERVRLEEELVRREVAQAEIQRDLAHAQRDAERFAGAESETAAERRRLERELSEERSRFERELSEERSRLERERSDERSRLERELADERQRLERELAGAEREQAVMTTRLERLDELRERATMLEETNNKLAFALKDAGEGYKQFLLTGPDGAPAPAALGEAHAPQPLWKRPLVWGAAAASVLVLALTSRVIGRMDSLESVLGSEVRAAEAKSLERIATENGALYARLDEVARGQTELHSASLAAAETARAEYAREIAATRSQLEELQAALRASESRGAADERERDAKLAAAQRAGQLARRCAAMRVRLAAVEHPAAAVNEVERVEERLDGVFDGLWSQLSAAGAEAELRAVDAECDRLEDALGQLERNERRRQAEVELEALKAQAEAGPVPKAARVVEANSGEAAEAVVPALVQAGPKAADSKLDAGTPEASEPESPEPETSEPETSEPEGPGSDGADDLQSPA